MSKIDIKDRKILYELDQNCRQSNSQIGKKVGLGRDVVSYRIKKMEEEGIIQNYWAHIDNFKLGYNVFRIYINFQYITNDVKEKIISYFVDYPNSWVVASSKSEIDLAVVIWVDNIYYFYKFWSETLDKFEQYFEKHTISIYIGADVYKKTFLLFDNKEEKRLICNMRCSKKKIEIDELDYKLLNELVVNARAQLIDLAEKFDCSSQSINYRIKNLLKSGVIIGFRVKIDLSKLNLQHFKLDIYLKKHKLKKDIIRYLEEKNYLEYMNYSMGWSDLEPEFVVRDMNEMLSILDEINNTFSGAIKKQSFFIVDKVYKLRCMPQIKF